MMPGADSVKKTTQLVIDLSNLTVEILIFSLLKFTIIFYYPYIFLSTLGFL